MTLTVKFTNNLADHDNLDDAASEIQLRGEYALMEATIKLWMERAEAREHHDLSGQLGNVLLVLEGQGDGVIEVWDGQTIYAPDPKCSKCGVGRQDHPSSFKLKSGDPVWWREIEVPDDVPATIEEVDGDLVILTGLPAWRSPSAPSGDGSLRGWRPRGCWVFCQDETEMPF